MWPKDRRASLGFGIFRTLCSFMSPSQTKARTSTTEARESPGVALARFAPTGISKTSGLHGVPGTSDHHQRLPAAPVRAVAAPALQRPGGPSLRPLPPADAQAPRGGEGGSVTLRAVGGRLVGVLPAWRGASVPLRSAVFRYRIGVSERSSKLLEVTQLVGEELRRQASSV